MENREMRTHFFHFLLAGPAFPVYIPATSCTDSSVVERLSYTQLVGGSNPSPRTIFRLNEAQTEEAASDGMPIMSNTR